MSALRFDRRHLAAQARVYCVLRAFSGLWYPGACGAAWVGDERDGMFTDHDGAGNWWGVAWSGAGLVALAFDHESDRKEVDVAAAQRRPLQRLPGLPASLRALAEQVAAQHEQLATAGLWIAGRQHRLSDRWDRPYAHGLERLCRLALDVEAALFAAQPHQSWLELASLSEPQARLAIRLAHAAARGPVTLTADDEVVLLRSPQPDAGPVTSAAAAATAEVLAAVGVVWQPDLAALDAAQRARDAAHVADMRETLGPSAFDLFEAARADDVERVRTSIAAGAPLDARTVAEQWQYTPQGDTPLIQALKAGARRSAALLIAAGADLAARNAFGQTALWWAASRGDGDNLATLIARGADPRVAADDGNSALHVAVAHGPTIVAALLRAGADPTARAWNGKTPADYARARGHHDVVDLLATGSPRS